MMQRIVVTLLAFSLAAAAEAPRPLTLKQAREEALRNHPKISVAELKALAARHAASEARAAYFPSAWANLGAVGTADASTRIASSGLPVSSVFDRASASVNLTQLVTDFGRTANLVESAKLRARAEEQNAEATRTQLLLQVDAAFFNALQAQAVRRVAAGTVKTRQLLNDQVSALASNQLKSELDASFAAVNLQEAKIALARGENDTQAAFTTLAALLGSREEPNFQLAEEALPVDLAGSVSDAIGRALGNRPDLAKLRLELDSAVRAARAERGLYYPSLSVQGTAGVIPYRDTGLNHDYVAAGVILNWPLFTGGANTAKRAAAEARAKAAEAALRDEETSVVRDVRIAWLNVKNAAERLALAEQLLAQSRQSHALAEAKYQAGSSSMVELGQAQLNLTSAEVLLANSRYEYLFRRSLLEYQTGALR